MTKEELIDMAKQAGIDIGMWEKLSDNDDVFGYDFCGIHENLEAFVKLIAEKEREACAKVCDDELKEWRIFYYDVGDVSKAIRARGHKGVAK